MSALPPDPPRRRRLSLATWSLLALGLGLLLGTVGHHSGLPLFGQVAKVVEPLGALWLAALQLTLLPLIVSQLLSSIVSSGAEPGASVGGLGLRAIILFVVLLALAGIVTAILTPPLLSFYRVDPAMVQSLTGAGKVAKAPETAPANGAGNAAANVAAKAPATAPAKAPAKQPANGAAGEAAGGDWSKRLPTNLIESARKGEILPILIFAALFGAAVTRLRDEYRGPLRQLLRGCAEAMMSVVRWILVGTPVGVFALTYVAALHAGGQAAGMMGAFILLVCVLLAFFIVLLYPVTAIGGRTSMREFARAAAPAQLVAISTLSSIAALPALIQGGADHLRLPQRVTGFVLPLSVSLFKINRTVSATAKLLFLAHVYGMTLSGGTLTVFMVTVIVLSFSTVGVPQGGQAFATLPAYLAAGIPVEGVILLEATAIAPDMLKTLLNVTGDMSVAAFLSRGSRRGAAVTADAALTDAARTDSARTDDAPASQLAPEGAG